MKTAVITGCNRGVGLTLLKRFTGEGYNVIAHARRYSDEWHDQCRDLEKKNNVTIFLMLMKKLLKIIIVIAVLAGVALGVKSIFFDGNTTSQVGALISSKVVTDTIKTTISATGSLEPVDQVEDQLLHGWRSSIRRYLLRCE